MKSVVGEHSTGLGRGNRDIADFIVDRYGLTAKTSLSCDDRLNLPAQSACKIGLTSHGDDGLIANMRATLIYRSKNVLSDETIVEMVIWKVPAQVPGSLHNYKYSLFYGRDGTRIVGFDNERMKGDHCHLDGLEQEYRFTTVEALIVDFLAEVNKWRRRQ